MKRKITKKIGTLFTAFSLAATSLLSPVPVMAAGTEDVYVMTELSTTVLLDSESKSFDVPSTSFAYTKKGLLKTCNTPWSATTYTYTGKKLAKTVDIPTERTNEDVKTVNTYSYSDDGLTGTYKTKSVYEDGDGLDSTTTLTYDKKGRLKKLTLIYDETPDEKYITTYTYNSKGQLTKETSNQNHWVRTFTYNKKGYIKKSVATYDGSEGATSGFTYDYTYTYDKNGNVKKKVERIDYVDETMPDSTNTTTYKYKKLTVKKSLTEVIDSQQWKLLYEEYL